METEERLPKYGTEKSPESFIVFYLDLETEQVSENERRKQLSVDEKASRSSGFFGLVRRNSIHFDRDVSKRAKTKGIPGHRASVHEAINYRLVPSDKPPACRRAVTERNENDELFAIWKRAERSRLDDQRGTEINFELPDFLKPKMPLEGSVSEPLPVGCRYRAYDARWSDITDASDDAVVVSKDDIALRGMSLCNESFGVDGIIPTQQQAEELFSTMCNRVGSPIFHDPKMTEKSLQDIGFEFHSRAEVPVRVVQTKKLVPRPSSHPMPQFSSRSNIQQVVNLTLEKNTPHLSSKSLNSTLHGNVSFSTTLAAERAAHDFLPPPNDCHESNFPTSSTRSSCRQFVQDNPPPLPPKPKLPPPRTVSLLNKRKPAGSDTLEAVSSGCGVSFMDSVAISQNKRPDLLNQISHPQKSLHVECDTAERFSISFV